MYPATIERTFGRSEFAVSKQGNYRWSDDFIAASISTMRKPVRELRKVDGEHTQDAGN